MKLPVCPVHPERICWGCERFCRADDLACGNGTIRTPHPVELFGDGWFEERDDWGVELGGEDPSTTSLPKHKSETKQ